MLGASQQVARGIDEDEMSTLIVRRPGIRGLRESPEIEVAKTRPARRASDRERGEAPTCSTTKTRGPLLYGLLSVLALATAGCNMTARDAFTAQWTEAAAAPSPALFKTWADAPFPDIARFLATRRLGRANCALNYLALSGGGADGAFGAGLLKGWSELGTRPSFDLVSGVSAGALIAPFAFLGSSYDRDLQLTFDGHALEDLGRLQNPFVHPVVDALSDPQPLRRLIENYVTPDLLAAIALQHRMGRRLLVVTTNLDAQRPTLWNMGAIAASDSPDSLKLFRDVLQASASVPGIFPPVMITSKVDEKSFQEMHVDGGATTPIFANPDLLTSLNRDTSAACRSRMHMWLVVNNTQPPEFKIVADNVVSISMRSYSTIIKAETKGFVTASFEASQRVGVDFNLAYIDEATGYDPMNAFRQDYMKAVFALGEERSLDGAAWRKSLSRMMEAATP